MWGGPWNNTRGPSLCLQVEVVVGGGPCPSLCLQVEVVVGGPWNNTWCCGGKGSGQLADVILGCGGKR